MKRSSTFLCGFFTFSWTLFSLYVVARLGGAVVLDPETTSRVMSTGINGRLYSAIGLTYTGVAGAALVIAQLVLVVGALVAILLPTRRVRRLGLTVIVLWALLWLGNSIWMETLSGGSHPSGTSLLGVVVLVILAFAVLRWQDQ